MRNKLIVSGEIGWDITAKEIKNQLKGLKGDIEIDLSSPGGSIYQGIEIFNAIKAYNKGEIHVVISGLAASMGSYIALAGDKVSAYDNATYMIHNGWAFTWGNHNDLRDTANVLESLSNILADAYADKTGRSKDEIKKMMDAETYFFGEEIINAGFIDEIISTKNNKKEDKNAIIAMAKQTFKDCVASAKQHAQDEKEEIGKLAALLSDNSATMPSQVEKMANNSKGDVVTPEELQAALDKANAGLATANTTIEANKTQLDGANAKVADLTAKLDEVNKALTKAEEDAKAKSALTATIVAMAFEHKASKEVALEMLGCDTEEKAGYIALKAKQSNGGSSQSDLSGSSQGNAWDGILGKKE